MKKSIHSPNQARFLKLLIVLRRSKGLTQMDLAGCLKKPQSFVSKYESGERRLDFLELLAICDALGVSLQEFVKHFEVPTNDG
jgi:transcriptional regulator with XRE-family HTH domain